MQQGGSELVTRVKTRLARLGRSTTTTDDDDSSTRNSSKHLFRHILQKSNTTAPESNESDTESYSRLSADEEDSDSEPKSKRHPPPQRASTLSECPPAPPLPPRPEDSQGCRTPPELFQNVPLEGLLEKLGHRLKERSDKVHKVRLGFIMFS